jgi:hypothetical protein
VARRLTCARWGPELCAPAAEASGTPGELWEIGGGSGSIEATGGSGVRRARGPLLEIDPVLGGYSPAAESHSLSRWSSASRSSKIWANRWSGSLSMQRRISASIRGSIPAPPGVSCGGTGISVRCLRTYSPNDRPRNIGWPVNSSYMIAPSE